MCRYYNCEHNDVQPIIELKPDFTVCIMYFDVAADETDNGKSYAFAIDILPGRNMITTAFSGNANMIDNWIKEKAVVPRVPLRTRLKQLNFTPLVSRPLMIL